MPTRHLLTLTRRSTKLHSRHHRRHVSTNAAAAPYTPTSPDPRFLQHNSPNPTHTSHDPILRFPATRATTLPTGLRVATQSFPSSCTATLGVWIDSGSRFETLSSNGTAHFLEHMIFKGTRRRSVGELEEEIENLGGHLNACTSREMTAYYANFMEGDVDRGLDILADVLQNSVLDEKGIERERHVILRELEEVESQTEEVVFDNLHAAAFQDTPLGRTILGPPENIKSISRDYIQDYISTHYTAPRMVVAASGAVKHEDFVKKVETLFNKLSTDPTTSAQLVAKEPATFTGSELRIHVDEIPVAQFAVAFRGASLTDPDSVALTVMQTMLGSWDKSLGGGEHLSSKLGQRIGIDEIAESVMAFSNNYKDTGLFGVYAVAKPDCLGDLAPAIMYELRKLCYQVSEEDVIRARNQVKSSLLLHLDGNSQAADDIGRQLVTYGRRIPMAEMFARIDAVDANTVKHVANRFMSDKDVAISALGPIAGLPDYNWFRSRTKAA